MQPNQKTAVGETGARQGPTGQAPGGLPAGVSGRAAGLYSQVFQTSGA